MWNCAKLVPRFLVSLCAVFHQLSHTAKFLMGWERKLFLLAFLSFSKCNQIEFCFLYLVACQSGQAQLPCSQHWLYLNVTGTNRGNKQMRPEHVRMACALLSTSKRIIDHRKPVDTFCFFCCANFFQRWIPAERVVATIQQLTDSTIHREKNVAQQKQQNASITFCLASVRESSTLGKGNDRKGIGNYSHPKSNSGEVSPPSAGFLEVSQFCTFRLVHTVYLSIFSRFFPVTILCESRGFIFWLLTPAGLSDFSWFSFQAICVSRNCFSSIVTFVFPCSFGLPLVGNFSQWLCVGKGRQTSARCHLIPSGGNQWSYSSTWLYSRCDSFDFLGRKKSERFNNSGMNM